MKLALFGAVANNRGMQDAQAITTTDFNFPGQTALYHGKVRDVYSIGEDTMVSVATDRISAFDVILPRPIPYKGQVLNQLAAHFLEQTEDIIDNWLVGVPDPNVSVGHRAQPFKVEMVIRGSLVGYSWRQYKAGERELCGVALPERLEEYDRFPVPIITPSTKAAEGHDEDISAKDIVAQGLATAEEWEQLTAYTRQLFARGQEMAAAQGLVLADTKYEFGTLAGKIILIDEIHTPDSSRYFYKDSYEAYIGGQKDTAPKHLSKEFVREWLLKNNFSGQTGQTIPEMTDEFVQSVSERYIELYEQLSGHSFEKADISNTLQRIEANVTTYLERNK
ncbi:MAG: purC [Candidatus Saccharibacteria bacterium]|nr:purC [Candidatus Saccharibacteria bacterium]